MASQPRVLVVDDDHECRLIISSTMAKAGFQVDAVGDGDMALATVRSRQPVLVLLDANLPRTDGFAVCKRIKEHEDTKDIPVVMITAFATEDARQRGLDAGADEFLEKPFRSDDLLELVDQLLDIRAFAEEFDVGAERLAAGLSEE